MSAGETITALLLSDSHGSIDPRIARLAAGCDYAVHAGDVGTAAVLDALRPKRRLVAVRGNNDTPAKWAVAERAALARLVDVAVLDLPGGRLYAVHGHRHGAPRLRHARLRASFDGARCVVYGHSHRLVCDTEETPWVVNPGACGRARTFGGPSCVLLTVRGVRWRLAVHRFAPQ